MGVAVRVLTPVASVLVLRTYWGNDCPRSFGGDSVGCHNAHSPPVARVEVPFDYDLAERHPKAADWPDHQFPTHCDDCGAPVPWILKLHERQVFRLNVYRAPDGTEILGESRTPGDMWPAPCWREKHGISCCWDNCTGTHWVVRCPGGMQWDTDSRASNCTRKDDRTHRCWVLQRNPDGSPHTSSKGGDTCGAGAGSIQTHNWHGWLRAGQLVE
jgi:hypothetical protein